jgi:hypothetical protein
MQQKNTKKLFCDRVVWILPPITFCSGQSARNLWVEELAFISLGLKQANTIIHMFQK